MRNLCRITLPIILTGLLVVVACSKPAVTNGPQSATPQETRQSAISAPANIAPAEPREEKKNDQKTSATSATSATPPSKTPVKQQPKRVAPPLPVAENPPAPPEPTQAPVPAPPSPPAVAAAPPAPENPPVAPAPPVRRITIPVHTVIAIRTIDSVDSRTDQIGQTFRASVDSDVIVDDQIVVPKGADAILKLTRVSSAGELRGKSELQLQLDRFVVGTKSYTVESNTVERSAAPQGPKTARDATIGAAIGAAIGAIAGGGKGAAIGAGAGAGAGVAVAAITKGEQVLVASETRLDFRLEREVEIESPPPASTPATENRFSPGPRKLGEGPNTPAAENRHIRRDVIDVSGEWDLSIVRPEGVRKLKLFLQQDGRNLRGSIGDVVRGETELRGKVEGDQITFATESALSARRIQSKYSGTIAGNRLQGTVIIRIINTRLGRIRSPIEQSLDWTADRIGP